MVESVQSMEQLTRFEVGQFVIVDSVVDES